MSPSRNSRNQHALRGEEVAAIGTARARTAAILEEREKEMGSELLMRVFRHFYIEDIDKQWVEHLTNMEHLRDGLGLGAVLRRTGDRYRLAPDLDVRATARRS